MVVNPKRNLREEFRQQAQKLADLLSEKSVLVTTHRAPDGDAIASLLAGTQIVDKLSGQPVGILDGVVPTRYRFLPGSDQLQNAQISTQRSGQKAWGAILVVDAGSLPRLGVVAEQVEVTTPLVNVDHHADNARFGALNIVEPEAASTTEILFDLCAALRLPLDPPLATILYTGLLTDTGGFRFSNTSERSFEMAAQLTAAGADPAAIAEAVYCENPAESIRLLGQAMASLELHASDRIASVTLPGDTAGKELEEVADFAMTVKGVRAAVFFRSDQGACRVSLRLRGAGDVSRLARRFGGGGHPKAAGFTYQGAIEEIRPQIIAALTQELESASTRNSDAA